MADKALSQFTPENHDAQTVDTSRMLNFGIIGAGWIAESYIESLRKMPDARISAADLIDGSH